MILVVRMIFPIETARIVSLLVTGLLMAALGVEAIKKFADTGEKPKPTAGKNFFDTGVALVTDKPAAGVESIDTKAGTDKCWG